MAAILRGPSTRAENRHPGDSVPSLNSEQIRQWRSRYNARVTELRRVHEDLMILRVRLDEGRLEHLPGQYTVLGLGNWEPRAAGAQQELLTAAQQRQMIKRAYSISCPMLDRHGCLLRTCDDDQLEFYVTIVRQAEHAPALTPRLFALSEGDRLFVGPYAHGRYTLEGIQPHENVVFCATGTGEAPHNAMLAELLARGHDGRIASLTCARWQRDLAYLEVHRQLEAMFPKYRYFDLTTREPRNLDASRPDYVGKQYLQEWIASGRFEDSWNGRLDPDRTHVFLCGNPAMIGLAHQQQDQPADAPQGGMVAVLTGRGFTLDEPHRPGNIHVEKYW
jgi:ferredoxin--NADP+ reductase